MDKDNIIIENCLNAAIRTIVLYQMFYIRKMAIAIVIKIKVAIKRDKKQ